MTYILFMTYILYNILKEWLITIKNERNKLQYMNIFYDLNLA